MSERFGRGHERRNPNGASLGDRPDAVDASAETQDPFRRSAQKRPRWGVAAYATLIVASLCINTWGGLERYPPFATADEVAAGRRARGSIALDSPLTWLVPWQVESGHERITMVPLRIAQVVFGDWLGMLGGGRMAHVFFGTVTVIALFGFGRQLVGDFVAWMAALLLAVSHTHVYLSRTFITSIQTSASFALLFWVLVGLREGQLARSWIPRAFLAGIILGWGVQTYRLAWAFPFLAVLTLFAWRRTLPTHWLAIAAVMMVGAVPITFLWAKWYYENYPKSLGYVANQARLSAPPESLAAWVAGFAAPMRRAATILWAGRDTRECYGASIPALDPVTGAALVLGLIRAAWHWRSRLSAFAAIWLPALMLGSVGLLRNGGSYHRLSVVLICVCLVSAWGASGLLCRIFPARFGHALCIAMLGAAAYFNLSYFFVQFPRESREHSTLPDALLLTSRVCRGEGSAADYQVLVDPERHYWRALLALQCRAEYQRLGVP